MLFLSNSKIYPIEEAVTAGGGYFLWTGCAAGDCGASMILKIG
ncbi:MAG TPA: hypothetical protein VLT88_08645 [Desulfosarcina sp.]|nr:hypothetical protein [Desulfosarcina sp.]